MKAHSEVCVFACGSHWKLGTFKNRGAALEAVRGMTYALARMNEKDKLLFSVYTEEEFNADEAREADK